MQTQGRKIWRDVLTRKTRTALVATSIFIGVLGVVTLFTMGDIMVKTMTSSVKEEDLAMSRIYVSLSPTDSPPDDTAYLEQVRALPGVTTAQGMAIHPVYFQEPGSGNEKFKEGRIFAYSEPFDAIPIEPLSLVKGEYPEAGQHEIAVERRFADRYGLEVGDQLTLRILSEYDGERMVEEAWTIAGTVFVPYQYPLVPGGPTQIMGEQMIFAAPEDARYIGGFRGSNFFLVRYTSYETAKANLPLLEATLSDTTPYVPLISIVENPAKNAVIEQVRSLQGVLALLAVVALVVSGFLVFNVINTMITEQQRQIGVMKSLGATGWDNFKIYAGLALTYGVMGVIPGVLLGIPAGFEASKSLQGQLNIFIDEFQISPTAIAWGIALGLLVPVLAALYPVIRSSRITILQAMTDLGIDAHFNGGWTARLLDKLPFPISMRQAFRNVLQKKGRLALTMITLSLAAGAFMGIYAMLTTMNTVIAVIFDTFGYEISITPSQTVEYETVQQLLIENIDGIEAIEPSVTLAIEVEGFEPKPLGATPPIVYGFGWNPHNPIMLNFDLRSGTAWSDDPDREGVVITTGIANELNKETGDTIQVRAGGTTREFEIIGVAIYPLDAVWFQWATLAELGGSTSGVPADPFTTTLQLNGAEVAAVGVLPEFAAYMDFSDGELMADGTGAIITAALAEAGGYAVGDSISLGSGDETRDYTITGIFTPLIPQEGQPEQVVGLMREELFDLANIPTGGDPVPNSFNVRLTDRNLTGAQVAEKMEEMNEVLLANGITASYTNWVESAELVSQLMNTSTTIFSTAALLLAAVGGIGLLSTLTMSVFERQKEIGVMRSIGATSGSVAAQFLVEGLIVGIIAWFIGIPLGYMLNDALVVAFHFEEQAAEVGYPLTSLVIGLTGMLLIAMMASLSPALAAARKTVSDILRYQ